MPEGIHQSLGEHRADGEEEEVIDSVYPPPIADMALDEDEAPVPRALRQGRGISYVRDCAVSCVAVARYDSLLATASRLGGGAGVREMQAGYPKWSRAGGDDGREEEGCAE